MRALGMIAAFVLSGWLAGNASVAFAQSQDDEITAAREKAVQFLKQRQRGDGRWEYRNHPVGSTALCTVALIENGVPMTDASVQKGYEYVRRNAPELVDTYDLAMTAVLLSRMGDRRDRPLLRQVTARLIAGQLESGGWSYKCPKVDTEVLRDSTRLPTPKAGFGDNSCTQFAVLGLWVASRAGIDCRKSFERVSARFEKSAKKDGGWAYNDDSKVEGSSPSMTGAGLFCLAVAEASRLREANKRKSPGESSGKEIASESPTSEEAPAAAAAALMSNPVFAAGVKRTGEFAAGIGAGSSRYFLWSLERVGVLLGLERFGDVPWFERGAAALLATQTVDGGWPPAWKDNDPDGLSDTAFALLFLRRANLGSDISRLLEGDPVKKFAIVQRRPVERFETLQAALAAVKPGETIRVDGPGPFKIGALDLKHDITIQAGFGYSPVFTFEVGVDRLGITRRPEKDETVRSLINVHSGVVTLEGLRLRMDPPKGLKTTEGAPVPWSAVTVRGGQLRLLNCMVSEANREKTTCVLLTAGGECAIRNSMLISSGAAVELVGSSPKSLLLDDSVLFSDVGVSIIGNDEKSPGDVTLRLNNSVLQSRAGLQASKFSGKVNVEASLSVFRTDVLASSWLPTPGKTKGRTWVGHSNLYDVKAWFNGKGNPEIKSATAWMKFWGNKETESENATAPFVTLRPTGHFGHQASALDWVLDVKSDSPLVMVRNRLGVNAYVAGPGLPFDQFRESLDYTKWSRGSLASASASAASAPK